MSDPKIMIEVGTYLDKRDKTVENYIKDLENMQKKADEIDLSGNISKAIQGAMDDLKKLNKEYEKTVQDLANNKLDTKAFEKFAQEVDSKMDEITGRIGEAEQSLLDLQKTINDLDLGKLQNQFNSIKTSFKEFKQDTKTAMKMLRDFQKLTDQSYGGKQLKELTQTLRDLSRIDLSNLNTVEVKKSLGAVHQELGKTYDEFLKFQKVLNDDKSSPKMIKNAEKQLAAIIPKLEQGIRELASKKKLSFDDIFLGKSNYKFSDANSKVFNLDKIAEDLELGLGDIKKRLIAQKEDLQKEIDALASTNADTFTFKNGGIQIPVVIDEKSKAKVETSLNEFIDKISKQTENNPIDVTLRLFPLKTSKKEAKEINNHIKDIRAQIPKLDNKELSDGLNDLVNDLEKEYQKALILKIKVEFSEDLEEIQRRIKLIETEAKKANITINPKFEITQKEAEKLNKKLEKISKDFSIDFDKRITTMADSLNRLFSETKITDWGNAFEQALQKIDSQLQNMKGLLEPLIDLYKTTEHVKEGAGRPSKEFLESKTSIDKFTETMDLLNKALAEREKAPKLNAEDFTRDIQKEIDAANIPVQVPVEPNVEGFVEQLEAKLKTIPVDIAINGITGGTVGGSGGGNIIIAPQNGTIEVEQATVTNEPSSTSETNDTKKAPTKVSGYKGISKQWINKEFQNVYFGERDRVNIPTEERKATSEFWDIYNGYIDFLRQISDKNNEISKLEKSRDKALRNISEGKGTDEDKTLVKSFDEQYKKLEEEMDMINKMREKHLELHPFLSSITDRRVSEGQKDKLLEEYLGSRGIKKTAPISSKTYIDRLREEVSGKGDFSRRTSKDKAAFNEVVKKFIGFEYKEQQTKKENPNYKSRGWRIEDLTDNVKAQKKLREEYNKIMGITEEIKENDEEIVEETERHLVPIKELRREYEQLASEKKKLQEIKVDQDYANKATKGSDKDVNRMVGFLKGSQLFKQRVEAAEVFGLKEFDYGLGETEPIEEAKTRLQKQLAGIAKTLGLEIDALDDFEQRTEEELKEFAKVYIAKKQIKDVIAEKDNRMKELEHAISNRERLQKEELEKKKESKGKKKTQAKETKIEKTEEETEKIKEETADIKNKEAKEENKQAKETKKKESKKKDTKKKKEVEEKAKPDFLKEAIEKKEGRKQKQLQQTQNTKDFDALKQFVASADLRKNTNIGKQNLQEIAKRFTKYKNNKGKFNVTDLSDDPKIQAKLQEAVDAYTASLKENQQAKEENSSTPAVNKEDAKDVEKATDEVKKNTEAQKENKGIREQVRDAIFMQKKKGEINLEGIPDDKQQILFNNTMAGVEKENLSVEKAVERFKQNVETYKELESKLASSKSSDLEEKFGKLRTLVSALGSLDQRKKGNKDNLQKAIQQYQKYVEAGGTRPITDLTDNVSAQEKLKEAYEETTAAIEKQVEVKKEDNKPVVYSKEAEGIKNANAQLEKRQQILEGISKLKSAGVIDFGDLSDGELQKLFDQTMEMVEMKDKSVVDGVRYFMDTLGNYKLASKQPEPSFIQDSTQAIEKQNKVLEENIQKQKEDKKAKQENANTSSNKDKNISKELATDQNQANDLYNTVIEILNMVHSEDFNNLGGENAISFNSRTKKYNTSIGMDGFTPKTANTSKADYNLHTHPWGVNSFSKGDLNTFSEDLKQGITHQLLLSLNGLLSLDLGKMSPKDVLSIIEAYDDFYSVVVDNAKNSLTLKDAYLNKDDFMEGVKNKYSLMFDDTNELNPLRALGDGVFEALAKQKDKIIEEVVKQADWKVGDFETNDEWFIGIERTIDTYFYNIILEKLKTLELDGAKKPGLPATQTNKILKSLQNMFNFQYGFADNDIVDSIYNHKIEHEPEYAKKIHGAINNKLRELIEPLGGVLEEVGDKDVQSFLDNLILGKTNQSRRRKSISSDSVKSARQEMQAEEEAYDASQRAKVEAERAGNAVVESQQKAKNAVEETNSVIDAQKGKFAEYSTDVALGKNRIERARLLQQKGFSIYDDDQEVPGLSVSYPLVGAADSLWAGLNKRGLIKDNPDFDVIRKAITEYIEAYLDNFDMTMEELQKKLLTVVDFDTKKAGFIPHKKKDNAKGGWQHFHTIDSMGHATDQFEGDYTYKTYGRFKNPSKLTGENIQAIMNALTKAGFKGQLKLPGVKNSDKFITSSDQLVIHGINSKMQELAYNVLKNQFGDLFSTIKAGFDKSGASFSELLVKKSREQDVKNAERLLAEQQNKKVSQSQSQVPAEIEKTNQKLEEEKSLYDKIYERVEAIRILGAVGHNKADLQKYAEGEYGFESPNHEARVKQSDLLRTLTPSKQDNPQIRDLVFDPTKSIKEVTEKLVEAGQDYQTAKEALDKLFADRGIIGGNVYDRAYRNLNMHADDSEKMLEVVIETKRELNMMEDEKNFYSSITSNINSQTEALEREEKQAQKTGESIREANERIAESLANFYNTGKPRALQDILDDINTIDEHLEIASKKWDEARDAQLNYLYGDKSAKLKRTTKTADWWIAREKETKSALKDELKARLEISKQENPNEYNSYIQTQKIKERNNNILEAINPKNPFKGTISFSDLRDETELTREYTDALKALGYEIKKITDFRGVESRIQISPIDDKAISDTKEAEKILANIGLATGEAYAEGIESTKSEAEQAGAGLANAANEGTADAQQSHSPSKVAEALGEYWGIGYANGIKKHKGEVEDAVRSLVMSGILSVQDLQGDLDALLSGGFGNRYKALKEPMENILGDYKKDTTKVSGQLKAAITRLSKAEDLSPEQLAKYDDTFTKWILEAERLGMDLTEFEDKYYTVRSKFSDSIDDNLGKVVNEVKKDIGILEKENKENAGILRRIQKIGQAYLGEEDVDVFEQTRMKETKNGQSFPATSYKVVGKNGSVTLDPNGRRIATKQTHYDDYSRKQETVNTLVKEQDKLLKDILVKEKEIGIARADGQEILAETLQKQVDEKQKLYEENTKALEALGEEEVLQQQLIKETEARKRQEELLDIIIAKRLEKQKATEAKNQPKETPFEDTWQKSLAYINQSQRKQLDKNISGKNLQKTIDTQLGINDNYDYFKDAHDKQGNWIGALADEVLEINSRYDIWISKYDEIIAAEKEVDRLTKLAEEAPKTYAKDLEKAKTVVSALKGELTNIAQTNLLSELSDEQQDIILAYEDRLEAIDKARAARKEVADKKEYDKQQKNIYDELGSKVKEYVNLRKEIARGKGLDGDIEKAEQLLADIAKLNTEIKDNGFFNSEFETKALKGLTTVDDEVLRIEENIAQKEQEKRSKKYEGLQGKLESAIYDLGFEKENGNPTAEFAQQLENKIIDIKTLIEKVNNEGIDVVTEDEIMQAEKLLEEVRQIRKEGKLTENRKANENSIQKNLAQINGMLSDNTKLSFKRTDVYKDLVSLQERFKNFDTSRPQSELAELTTELLKTKARFEDLDNTVKGKNLFQTFIERIHGTTAQLVAQYLSWMDIIRYIRTMATTVIDLDTQLVDLRKTTSMTTSELNEFYNASSGIAKQLGVTTSEIISQSAAWSRLGYSSKEAATQMAQLSSKFASISPGMTTENSTDYLVSTMQANIYA